MEEVKQYESLSYEQLSQISRDDHQEDVRQYDKQQNALCLVVIGFITLVCGVLFIIISITRRMNKITGIDVTSLPFIVSIACFIAAITLLTIGFVRFFVALRHRTVLRKEINRVNVVRSQMISTNE